MPIGQIVFVIELQFCKRQKIWVKFANHKYFSSDCWLATCRIDLAKIYIFRFDRDKFLAFSLALLIDCQPFLDLMEFLARLTKHSPYIIFSVHVEPPVKTNSETSKYVHSDFMFTAETMLKDPNSLAHIFEGKKNERFAFLIHGWLHLRYDIHHKCMCYCFLFYCAKWASNAGIFRYDFNTGTISQTILKCRNAMETHKLAVHGRINLWARVFFFCTRHMQCGMLDSLVEHIEAWIYREKQFKANFRSFFSDFLDVVATGNVIVITELCKNLFSV